MVPIVDGSKIKSFSKQIDLNVPQKIFSNTAYIILGNFANKLISLLILILLTRHLGVADFGKFSFVIFYVTFFGIFTDLGLNAILVRECSRHPEMAPRLLGNVILTRFGLTLISAFAASLVILLLDYPPDVRLLVYIASIMLFISFRGIFFRMVFEAPFQVYLRMHYPSIINILNEIFTLGVIIAVTALQGTLTHVIFALTLANLPGFLVLAYLSTKIIRPVFSIDIVLIRKMLKEAFPLGISGFMESLFILLPVLFLSYLTDNASVGHYSLAFRLASSLWIIPTAFMMSLYPFLSQYAQGPGKQLQSSCISGLKAMSFIVIPMAILVTAFAEPIIVFISGESYLPAASPLKILILATAFYFLNTVFSCTLNAANLQNKNLVAWSLMTISLLILTVILVPIYGFTGASVAVFVSLTIGFGSYAVITYKTLGIKSSKMFLKFLCAGVIMGLIVVLSGEERLLVSILIALPTYIAIVVGLNILTKEDYIMIRRLYGSSNS